MRAADRWRRERRSSAFRLESRGASPTLAALVLLSVLATAALAHAQADSIWVKPRAALHAEFGIDSLQRKFYQPEFSFSWPLHLLRGSRAFVDLSYLERISGSLKGAIDFWLLAGLETRVSETVSFEAGLNHFCRHVTSTYNPNVLDLNELVGRIWVRDGPLAIGLGFGPYVGGEPGFDELMVVNFNLARFIFPELSLESELKWVNFDEIYYDARLAVGLVKGADIFLRLARHYDYPTTTYIGVRLGSAEPPAHIVDVFNVETGYYPYYDEHKLLVLGGFRLRLLDEPTRRFLLDVDFRTPILAGTALFAESWPDRMLYSVAGQYEKSLPGGLFGAWYARYDVDMPVDKPVHFRSSLATGLLIRNQRDFNRLEKTLRFEAAAGYDFTFDYDLRLRLGAQAKLGGLCPVGGEFRIDANADHQTVEFKAFAAFGKTIEVRPFVGVRKVTYFAGPEPPEDEFQNRVTAGLTLFGWF